jgi:hypothetical protein
VAYSFLSAFFRGTIRHMPFDLSRRKSFEVAAPGGLLSSARRAGFDEAPAVQPPESAAWFRRTYRWMQTNIAEFVTRYDIPWWREQWKRTGTQGIVVNAGGIVAYYPTEVPAFPPEAVWLREDHTDVAGLVVNERGDGTRVAYLAADLDRRYARDNIS